MFFSSPGSFSLAPLGKSEVLFRVDGYDLVVPELLKAFAEPNANVPEAMPELRKVLEAHLRRGEGSERRERRARDVFVGSRGWSSSIFFRGGGRGLDLGRCFPKKEGRGEEIVAFHVFCLGGIWVPPPPFFFAGGFSGYNMVAMNPTMLDGL